MMPWLGSEDYNIMRSYYMIAAYMLLECLGIMNSILLFSNDCPLYFPFMTGFQLKMLSPVNTRNTCIYTTFDLAAVSQCRGSSFPCVGRGVDFTISLPRKEHTDFGYLVTIRWVKECGKMSTLYFLIKGNKWINSRSWSRNSHLWHDCCVGCCVSSAFEAKGHPLKANCPLWAFAYVGSRKKNHPMVCFISIFCHICGTTRESCWVLCLFSTAVKLIAESHQHC